MPTYTHPRAQALHERATQLDREVDNWYFGSSGNGHNNGLASSYHWGGSRSDIPESIREKEETAKMLESMAQTRERQAQRPVIRTLATILDHYEDLLDRLFARFL
ncbi:MAG TPA: hypothetical protein VJB87_03260 [Candidatus Nanoarchaeia archaeon]|nr:hypothetical protein [Candidatus Nanoarchaeia archaeon]